MDSQPPIYGAQPNKDDEHLKLISIFHFIFSGLALVGGIGFLAIHFLLLSTVVMHSQQWTRDGSAAPPGFYAGFIFFYVLAALAILTACVLNLLSGIFLRHKKNRTFSLVVACLNCLQIPFGTALGVFTLIVLLRDSVRRSYLA